MDWSESEFNGISRKKTTNIEVLTKQISEWRIEAQNEKDRNAESIATLDDDDDAEMELEGKDEILGRFLSQTEGLGSQLRMIKLDQRIRNIVTHEDARVQIGMTESVVSEIEKQYIEDIINMKGSEVQIGIYR